MKIHHVRIERFRGIRELDWPVGGDFVCLIGPGDSMKSTILDAIELALSPRWNIPFDDTDFYNADVSEPIVISVIVGGIPEELKRDTKYGLETRGWSQKEGLRDEPRSGDELVFSIQLQVDSTLVPSWKVISERMPEGRPISHRDRERLGLSRLGAFVDWHLSWSPRSVLSRLTGNVDELADILAEASRAARRILKPDHLSTMHTAARRAQDLGTHVGVAPSKDYRPGLDVKAANGTIGGITLHDGEVPVRLAGLGTRRLLTLALQRDLVKEGGITIIDEVEYGLEPHRVRRLLNVLRYGSEGVGARETDRELQLTGQVLMTTHSPVVLVELHAEHLRIVRACDGLIEILSVGGDLQPLVRKAPDAFLGRKVIVCEGKTELGICRELDRWWSGDGDEIPFAYLGVIPVDGGGSDAPAVALALANLGYQVAFMGDSDRQLNPDPATMELHGVSVLLWAEDVAVEQRMAGDLPWSGVIEMVQLAMDEWGEESVRSAIAFRLGIEPSKLAGSPISWIEDQTFRECIGLAAKEANNKRGWFKRIDLGEKLGNVITRYLDHITETDLAKKISTLREWVDGDERG